MASSRVMRSVLWNMLGTYASRYSEFDGYWLFGFLVEDLGELRIDLRGAAPARSATPVEAATHLAIRRFQEQVTKSRLDPGQIRSASLVLRRLPGTVQGVVNEHACEGYRLRLAAEATMASGRRYEKERTVLFVAPHDPSRERRSQARPLLVRVTRMLSKLVARHRGAT
jgi:hypothetical protein